MGMKYFRIKMVPIEDFEASFQFLMGQMMKKSKGSANPKIAEKILREILRLK